MPLKCWECGQDGHLRRNCPQVQCRACGRDGHLTQNCRGTSGAKTQQRNNGGGDQNASTAHQLPPHWLLHSKYGESIVAAVNGLGTRGCKFSMVDASLVEFQAIEKLVQQTWRENKVGKEVDGMNLHHREIKVVKVQRIENPGKFEKYSSKKQDFLNALKGYKPGASVFKRLETIAGNSGPIWTTKYIQANSFLRGKVYTRINEHYLFHGTKENNVVSIAEDGFSMGRCLERSLMGAALYFAESSTKADMYADFRNRRTEGHKHMFLVRVLLGDAHLNTVRQKQDFRRPPCKGCLDDPCTCSRHDYYDSIIGDSGRPFRIFVVYEPSQCYPEYLITYRRVHDGETDDEEDEDDCDDVDDDDDDSDTVEDDGRYFTPLVYSPPKQELQAKPAKSSAAPPRPTMHQKVPALKQTVPAITATQQRLPALKQTVPAINATQQRLPALKQTVPAITATQQRLPALKQTVPAITATQQRLPAWQQAEPSVIIPQQRLPAWRQAVPTVTTTQGQVPRTGLTSQSPVAESTYQGSARGYYERTDPGDRDKPCCCRCC